MFIVEKDNPIELQRTIKYTTNQYHIFTYERSSMLFLVALMSLCYSLQISAAAEESPSIDGKNMFAEPQVHSKTLINFLPNDCSQRIDQLTVIQALASSASKATITHTIGKESTKESMKDVDFLTVTLMSQLNKRYIEEIDLILPVLAKANKPLCEYVSKLTREHPESPSFLVAWSAHQLSKVGSELFEDKQ